MPDELKRQRRRRAGLALEEEDDEAPEVCEVISGDKACGMPAVWRLVGAKGDGVCVCSAHLADAREEGDRVERVGGPQPVAG